MAIERCHWQLYKREFFDHNSANPTSRLLIVAEHASVKFFEYNQLNNNIKSALEQSSAVPDTIFSSIQTQ